MKAIKSVKQQISINSDLEEMMILFVNMVNLCIKIGLKENTHNMKRLSYLCYHELRNYDVLSSYKLNAISRAAGILSNRKQSIKRGRKTKYPIVKKPFLTNCYGIKHNGSLLTIPYKRKNPINILLNDHTTKILSDPTLTVRSFSLTAFNISLCISKDVKKIKCTKIVGIDRNLRNVTCGNSDKVVFYKMNKLLSIKENTINARSGFHRKDKRKKAQFWNLKNKRLPNRTTQFIHKVSSDIIKNALDEKSMLVLEKLDGIRKLYRKGNGQGNKYRRKLNGWQFYELQRQIQYKANWVGLPVRYIDPRNTSKLCPKCGKKLQGDKQHRRKMLCTNCGLFMDRDVIASMNIAHKAWTRFIHARDDTSEAGCPIFEGPMPEPKLIEQNKLVIRIVDVSKCKKHPDYTEPNI